MHYKSKQTSLKLMFIIETVSIFLSFIYQREWPDPKSTGISSISFMFYIS